MTNKIVSEINSVLKHWKDDNLLSTQLRYLRLSGLKDSHVADFIAITNGEFAQLDTQLEQLNLDGGIFLKDSTNLITLFSTDLKVAEVTGFRCKTIRQRLINGDGVAELGGFLASRSYELIKEAHFKVKVEKKFYTKSQDGDIKQHPSIHAAAKYVQCSVHTIHNYFFRDGDVILVKGFAMSNDHNLISSFTFTSRSSNEYYVKDSTGDVSTFVSTKEAAEFIGCSASTLIQYFCKNKTGVFEIMGFAASKNFEVIEQYEFLPPKSKLNLPHYHQNKEGKVTEFEDLVALSKFLNLTESTVKIYLGEKKYNGTYRLPNGDLISNRPIEELDEQGMESQFEQEYFRKNKIWPSIDDIEGFRAQRRELRMNKERADRKAAKK